MGLPCPAGVQCRQCRQRPPGKDLETNERRWNDVVELGEFSVLPWRALPIQAMAGAGPALPGPDPAPTPAPTLHRPLPRPHTQPRPGRRPSCFTPTRRSPAPAQPASLTHPSAAGRGGAGQPRRPHRHSPPPLQPRSRGCCVFITTVIEVSSPRRYLIFIFHDNHFFPLTFLRISSAGSKARFVRVIPCGNWIHGRVISYYYYAQN